MSNDTVLRVYSQGNQPSVESESFVVWSVAFDQVYLETPDQRDLALSDFSEYLLDGAFKRVIFKISNLADWTVIPRFAAVIDRAKDALAFCVEFRLQEAPSKDQLSALSSLPLATLEHRDETYSVSMSECVNKNITDRVLDRLEMVSASRDIETLKLSLNKAKKHLSEYDREVRNLKLRLTKQTETSRMLRRSTSFRLGKTLLDSLKSPKRIVKLPFALWALFRDGKPQRVAREIRRSQQHSATQKRVPKQSPSMKSFELSVAPVAPDILARGLATGELGRLKVAAIMDEFTYFSYEPDCDLMQLEPENLGAQLDDFAPDLIFIESAWKGKSDLWKGKVSSLSSEVCEVIEWARSNQVATVMWNKEDPVHFSSFLPLASLVDYVFTTDVDCVPAYKAALGHDRVSYLGFAAQPLTHNPIEKFKRLDRFCFAGSYYLRYPERQRDFEAIISAAFSFKPVDIYDRNFNNPHPHYTFPERYRGLIKGSLPFDQIEKAYKGYRYGINLNTIKQSQSMFARRVYELIASNTIVVSNYSRGVENVFSERVLCSDDQDTLEARIMEISRTEESFKEYRLEALRFVLSKHLYRHRLEQIVETISNGARTNCSKLSARTVHVFAIVADEEQLSSILRSMECQLEVELIGHIFIADEIAFDGPDRVNFYTSDVKFYETLDELSQCELSDEVWVGLFDPSSVYEPYYCLDLLLSREYSDSKVFTKLCYRDISRNGSVPNWNNAMSEYQPVNSFVASRSIFQASVLNDISFDDLRDLWVMSFDYPSLSIDGLNYTKCFNAGAAIDYAIQRANSLPSNETPEVDFSRTQRISDSFTREVFSSESKVLTGAELSSIGFNEAAGISCALDSSKSLLIRSQLKGDTYQYLYLDKVFTREELRFDQNSQYLLNSDSSVSDLRVVIEFQDEDGKKLSHQMNRFEGNAVSVAVPFESHSYRIGFRIEGAGSVKISEIAFGKMIQVPASIVSNASTLVLAKQYPSNDDIYRYGFLHSRLKGYREKGLRVQMFRFTNEAVETFRHYDGISIAQGDAELLDRTLSSGQYSQVLVHLLDRSMWEVLKKYVDDIQITIWAHGAEIQLWQRRAFEFERMDESEIKRQKQLSDNRFKFWNEVLGTPHKNVHTVFVSHYFKEEVCNDFGLALPVSSYTVIPNFIDENVFPYRVKSAEDRLKVLSIRPYASRKYANDLSVAAVLELSKRACFEQMQFCFVGDGPLFDETLEPIRGFSNVEIRQGFLTQSEISEMHRDYGVFLSPTRMDSQGVSRDEAMSSGLVPITNGVTAIPEFVDSECGMIVPGEDYVAMADALETLCNDPELFLRLSASAADRVRHQSGFEATIGEEVRLVRSGRSK